MARQWTNAQKAAIGERDRTLLVSAAAGSGKTAVLTERIIRTLSDPENPTDISRLLVVTFTRAAAAEMRARIAKSLSDALLTDPKNTLLRRQLMLLGSAKISTIDSFYLDLVRANFETAGFSPSFRLANEGELLSLRRDTMNAAIDRMYAEEPDFLQVAALLSDVRAEQGLTDKLLELDEKLQKLPEAYGILLRSATENETLYRAPFDSPLGTVLFGALQKTAAAGEALFQKTLSLLEAEPEAAQLKKKFGAMLGEMATLTAAVSAAIGNKDLDALTALLRTVPTARVGSHKLPTTSDDFLEAVEACRAFREQWRPRAAAIGVFDTAELREGGKESAALLRLLHRVLTVFGESYRAAKAEREVAEFSDVSRAAYRLLVGEDGKPTALAASVAASFDAVYIDEYQDVDAMQDASFRAISTPKNRFMVGDIKQSIYRFRGAEPSLFAAYRAAFPDLSAAADTDAAATVFMSDCFRCDENVIRFSNTVSGYLFSRSADSIGYKQEDDLNFSKPLPHAGYLSPKCRVLLYDAEDESSGDVTEDEDTPTVIDDAEARMITEEICRLLAGEKKADGTPIAPGDIAVLARGAAFAAPLAKHLTARGIPVNDTSRENFFENPEVLCVYALLATIDNPFRDVYLAAVLRSPLFGFTLEELVRVRGAADGSLSLFEAAKAAVAANTDAALCRRLAAFLDKLSRYREKAELLPVDKLLRYLYRDTAVMTLAGNGTADFKYRNKRQNLERLYEYARCFEAGGFKGLYRFVRYVEDIMQNGTEMPTPEGPRNAVSLITIHHSKGLEFPVCFVATAGKLFNTDDQKEKLLLDSKLGCGTRVPNMGAFSHANTFAREAVKERLSTLALEEEMRVLYVAMTRARERLYITAKPRFGIKSLQKRVALAGNRATDFFALCGTSYIEWILSALATVDHSDFCEIITVHPADLAATTEMTATEAARAEAVPDDEEIETARATLEARFSYRYPAAHLSRLPAKLSVSRLSPEVLDVYDTDAASAADLADPDVQKLLHTFARAPRFDRNRRETPDAAARGTATHEFLQFCDFARAAKDSEAELERLIEARFLSPDTRTAVRRDELKRFFESEFYKQLQDAHDIYRETRFNVLLPAADFTASDELKIQLMGEQLLVQGVIDLFFTDAKGRLVLCDYKTDRLPEEALKNADLAAKFLFARHGDQLGYYEAALEAILGRRPDRTVIYSLPFGEALTAN